MKSHWMADVEPASCAKKERMKKKVVERVSWQNSLVALTLFNICTLHTDIGTTFVRLLLLLMAVLVITIEVEYHDENYFSRRFLYLCITCIVCAYAYFHEVIQDLDLVITPPPSALLRNPYIGIIWLVYLPYVRIRSSHCLRDTPGSLRSPPLHVSLQYL